MPRRREWQPLQYSCLENSMDRAWRTTVYGVAELESTKQLTLSLLSDDAEQFSSLIRTRNPGEERTVTLSHPVSFLYKECALPWGFGYPCTGSPRDLSLSLWGRLMDTHSRWTDTMVAGKPELRPEDTESSPLLSRCCHPWAHSLLQTRCLQSMTCLGFPGGSVVKNLPTNAGDTSSIPGPGRCHMLSPGACALESGNHDY